MTAMLLPDSNRLGTSRRWAISGNVVCRRSDRLVERIKPALGHGKKHTHMEQERPGGHPRRIQPVRGFAPIMTTSVEVPPASGLRMRAQSVHRTDCPPPW